MRDVLGVLPVLSWQPLVRQRLDGQTLVASALRELAGVADDVVVWSDDPAATADTVPRGSLYAADRVDELSGRLAAARVVIIHDPLCPLVPASFIRQLARTCASGRSQVGVRPVVDTIKATEGDLVSGTVDRDGLRLVTAPLVVTGALASALLPELVAGASLAQLVQTIRGRSGESVDLVVAPSAGRRVTDVSDLRLMSSVGAVSHRIREHD